MCVRFLILSVQVEGSLLAGAASHHSQVKEERFPPAQEVTRRQRLRTGAATFITWEPLAATALLEQSSRLTCRRKQLLLLH